MNVSRGIIIESGSASSGSNPYFEQGFPTPGQRNKVEGLVAQAFAGSNSVSRITQVFFCKDLSGGVPQDCTTYRLR